MSDSRHFDAGRGNVRAGQEARAAAPNVLANGSFEGLDNGRPKSWRSVNWEAQAEFGLDDAYARSGLRSVRISSTSGADASWQGVAAVKPFAKYR